MDVDKETFQSCPNYAASFEISNEFLVHFHSLYTSFTFCLGLEEGDFANSKSLKSESQVFKVVLGRFEFIVMSW
jgi:hypothetical protein